MDKPRFGLHSPSFSLSKATCRSVCRGKPGTQDLLSGKCLGHGLRRHLKDAVRGNRMGERTARPFPQGSVRVKWEKLSGDGTPLGSVPNGRRISCNE